MHVGNHTRKNEQRASNRKEPAENASTVPEEYAHALYKATEELERLPAARIAREDVASSTDTEAAPPSAEVKEEQPEKQDAENAIGRHQRFGGARRRSRKGRGRIEARRSAGAQTI